MILKKKDQPKKILLGLIILQNLERFKMDIKEELIKKKKLKKFEFEIDNLKDVLGITEFGFARIDIPLRQAKALSRWLMKELKNSDDKK